MMSRFIMPFFKNLSVLLLSLTLLPQQAGAVHWTINGPGVTDLIVTKNKVVFSYDLDVRRSYGVFEWELTGHDFDSGNHVFDWDYNGSHDRSQTATILRVEDQELVSGGSGRDDFLYEGRDLNVQNKGSGDLNFRMLATNDDTTQALTGTLELTILHQAADFTFDSPPSPSEPFPTVYVPTPLTPFPDQPFLNPSDPYPLAPVPIPAALYPFAVTLLGFVGLGMRRRRLLLRDNAKA